MTPQQFLDYCHSTEELYERRIPRKSHVENPQLQIPTHHDCNHLRFPCRWGDEDE